MLSFKTILLILRTCSTTTLWRSNVRRRTRPCLFLPPSQISVRWEGLWSGEIVGSTDMHWHLNQYQNQKCKCDSFTIITGIVGKIDNDIDVFVYVIWIFVLICYDLKVISLSLSSQESLDIFFQQRSKWKKLYVLKDKIYKYI